MSTLIELQNSDQIYREYYPKVFQYLVNRMGNVHDAEDMAQTVFVKRLSFAENRPPSTQVCMDLFAELVTEAKSILEKPRLIC